jgi:hypothetical protein
LYNKKPFLNDGTEGSYGTILNRNQDNFLPIAGLNELSQIGF